MQLWTLHTTPNQSSGLHHLKLGCPFSPRFCFACGSNSVQCLLPCCNSLQSISTVFLYCFQNPSPKQIQRNKVVVHVWTRIDTHAFESCSCPKYVVLETLFLLPMLFTDGFSVALPTWPESELARVSHTAIQGIQQGKSNKQQALSLYQGEKRSSIPRCRGWQCSAYAD